MSTPPERPEGCTCSWTWSFEDKKMVIKYYNSMCPVIKHGKDALAEQILEMEGKQRLKEQAANVTVPKAVRKGFHQQGTMRRR